MGEKLGFTNCVFEKLCSSENTIFIVFSAKHSSCNKKAVVEKTENFMKNSGLFLNMAKWCFLGLFFEVLMVLWFVFCVSGIVAKVLKMLVFPSFLGAFVWWLILVYLGLEGLGVLWFLFLLFFCSGFVFVCFGFGFVLLLDCCWCCSCFVFLFFSFLLFFVF